MVIQSASSLASSAKVLSPVHGRASYPTWGVNLGRRTGRSLERKKICRCYDSADPHSVAKVAALLQGQACALLKNHPQVSEVAAMLITWGPVQAVTPTCS